MCFSLLYLQDCVDALPAQPEPSLDSIVFFLDCVSLSWLVDHLVL